MKPESKIVVKATPYREGSARAKLLGLVRKARTVGAFLKLAGKPSGGSARSYLQMFVRDRAVRVL